MLITRPDYFDRFHCIAGACPDSCCKEWDVQVDAVSAEIYRTLPGELGDRLREVLHTEDGETVMTITLFAVLIYELVGPLLTKIALTKAGDIKPEERKSARDEAKRALSEKQQ
jgi:hypothetical protein